MEQYIKNHINRGEYFSSYECGGGRIYRSRCGWEDIEPGRGVMISHRTTEYTHENFSEGMHSHEYGELIIYIGGGVEYIAGNEVFSPRTGGAVWVPPGVMHTARLISPSVYERYVVYYTPRLFEIGGIIASPSGFDVRAGRARVFQPDSRVLECISAAESAAISGESCGALAARSLIISAVWMLSEKADDSTAASGTLTGEPARIKRYIDENYASIRSIGDVAAEFFYSREHLSRMFREHFNISPAEYLKGRRVLESLSLLEYMSVADACYAVGFGNQTSYIAAFRRQMGCLPSEYKRVKDGLNFEENEQNLKK